MSAIQRTQYCGLFLSTKLSNPYCHYNVIYLHRDFIGTSSGPHRDFSELINI